MSLKVSLPPHLRELLEPLNGLLPIELNAVVIQSLDSTQILYDTLVDVSNWAFTDDGQTKLKDANLNPKDYSRLSLLAGTITSPASRLPPPEPKPEPWEIAQEEKNSRRAIAALVNCVFSMLGVGTAVWWASKTTGWSDEVRIALSLFAGLFTGLAEGGLFIIYYNRRENERQYRDKMRKKKSERLMKQYLKAKEGKKEVTEGEATPEDNAGSEPDDTERKLRKRVTTKEIEDPANS